jgi:cytochrome c
MKMYSLRLFIGAFLLAGVMSCGSSGSGDNAAGQGGGEPEGLTIMKRYDCQTCHNATSKIVGPSFKDIAAKYPNTPENLNMLAGKVIAGGSGVWGTVPMAAHPTLPNADAQKIIAYMLATGAGK